MSPARLERPVEDARAWTRDTLREADWRMPVPARCLEEIDRAIGELARHPVPRWLLDPSELEMSACAELMAEVKRRLDHGPGVVLLDRFPVEAWSREVTADVFWLLGAMVERPVAQTIDGQMMVEVTDTGVKKTVGVRGFRTNVGQHPHVDNSFNQAPPDYVTLLNLQAAREGGVSQFVSFFSVHNRLLEESPALLERLYQPFYQDRQGDFWPDEPQTILRPVFELGSDGDSDLRCRYTNFTIPAGYETAGVPLDEPGREAFESMTRIIEDQGLYCEFLMQPGELQLVNNRYCGHGRTAYVDDPARPRLALRLWQRGWGRRRYSG